MKKIFTHLLAVLMLSLVTTSAWAQTTSFTSGKVYHFQNAGNTGVALGASALTDVAAISVDDTDKSQLWYCETQTDGTTAYYTFRNLVNGRYLSGNGTSASWGLTADNSADANLFELTVSDSYITIRSKADASNGYAYMHKDGGNNIVGWSYSGNNNTLWTITTVDYTSDQLDELWAAVDELIPSEETVTGYQEMLSAMFADNACTELNETYAAKSLSDIQKDDNYTGLPEVLQKMVDKVYNEQVNKSTAAWDEDNAVSGKSKWDNDYAKKFRVQMYEPYSIAGEVTSYLRFNAHSNMDNPTGIYANAEQPVYIMVDGDIADGAELWVVFQSGHGATGSYNSPAYTQLEEGLNVVPYFADGSYLWIDYVVHTYDKDGATITDKFPAGRQLSKYNPLKIHIEGGYINGYFNAIGDFRATGESDNLWGDVDNDEDWAYYKERAPLNGTDAPNRDFPLLGSRQTLLFEFGDITDGDGNTQKGISYWLDVVASGLSGESETYLATPNCSNGTYGQFGTYDLYEGLGLDAENGRINMMIEAWDRIMYSELATMGLVSTSAMDKMNALYPRWTTDNTPAEIYNYGSATVNGVAATYKEFCQGVDYSEHFNHHGTAQASYSGYMSGGWAVCNYHYNTMGSVIGVIAAQAGPTWGPAHEIGHQHQGTINLNGQTEVTNNLFSNVAVWYMGMGTSRYNGSEGNLEHVLDAFNTENGDAYTNNIWALTHMYYRLWLYYHLAGNNTQFWPRLYELCRQVPLGNGTSIDGETSFLRFYQHACDAAGEDLTEFFRAHGYLTPMEDRLVGDYTSATYNMTQAQVDAAIEAVKAKNYPVNYAVLLINDGTSETTVKHDGATARALWDGSASAELGSVNDFIDGETSVTGDYTATVSADGTVTMTGEGGIGFLVFNDEGELVSFSNKTTFELSDEAAYLVATGQATISVANGTNTIEVAEVDLTAIQSSLISSLINDVDEILKYVDDTYTKVGYYKASAVKDLQAALATAKETLETGEGIAAAYEILYTEYRKVMDNDDAKVAIISGAKYAIKSKSGSDYMDVDDSGNVTTTNSSTFPTEDSDLWIIEVVSADTYNIKNASTGKYLQQVSDANSVNFTVGDNAVNYKITNVDNVLYAFSTTSYSNRYMDRHSATQVATWGTGISNNAKWWITLADDDVAALSVSTAELQALIEKTENLVGTLATVEYAKGTPFELQTTQSGSPYYVSTNAQQANEGPIANLVDGDVTNYFHTNWANGNQTPGSHYIIVDLGASNSLDMFMFSCTARNGGDNQDLPYGINIFGSNDNSAYSLITDDVNPDFALTKGEYWETVDPVVATQSYRYLRFNVYASRGYWAMAEFDLYPVSLTVTLLSAYAEYSAILETSLISDAHNGVELGKAWLNYDAATSAEIEAYTETLQEKYDALYAAYKQVIDSEKAKLQSIIDDTEGLITQVGTATVIADADIDLLGKLYAERVYDADTGSSDYSTAEAGYNLLDGDVNTHFHSDYVFSTMVSPPYIRVDLGDGNTASKFEFNYTTRNQTGCAPTTLNVYGSNEQDDNYTLIKTFTSDDSDNPLPTAAKTSWTSSEVTSATAYRYFKFEVAVSEGSKTESSVTKYYFAISEFGFRKFGEVSATINQEYESMVSESLLIDTRRTVNASETMVGYATDYVVTVEQLKAQTAAQQAAYDKLYAAMTAVDKTALEELIAATESLKNGLYKQTYTQGEALALQADDNALANYLYCNASESNSSYDTDNLGVAALLDSDESNFLHTEWTGDQSADGLDHYLRVDLGEEGELSNFVFSYKSSRDLPKVIIVEGCNTADGDYERIGVHVGENSTSTLITSDLLGNGKAYRYLRFRVTQNYTGRKDNSGYHYYFVLNDFDVYSVTDMAVSSELKDEYAVSIYKYSTATLVSEVEAAITSANGVKEATDATQVTVDAEVETLQAVYDKLAEALKYAGLPVTITTDEENPVLYKIISKRADDDSYVLQFDEPTTNKVKIVNPVDNSSYQAWYFMEGEGGYLIKPFNGSGKVLSVESTGDDSAKANIAEDSENIYSEWTFSRSTVEDCTDYFYIYVDGTGYACLSHNGDFDTTDKLGIWSGGWNTNDGGSLFKFVEAEFDNDNARYYQLSDFENTLEYQTADTPEGTTVGAFVNGTAYSAAYSTASALIEAGNTSAAADCYAAYTALRTESNTVTKIVPEEGKYYRIDITPGLTDSRAGASMCIDEMGKLACGVFDEANARFYFTFEYDADGNLYMRNFHTATYLDEALTSENNSNVQVGADAETITDAESNVIAKSVTINTLGKSGDAVVVGITPVGGDMLNCAAKDGNVVAYNNTAVDKASAWVITEVADITPIKHNVTMSAVFSSVTLGYNATVPAGVKAYNATGIDGGYVTLEEIANGDDANNNVIPANTPVVLYRTDDGTTKTFNFTESTVAQPTESLLGGSLYTKYVECDDADYYKLMIKSGEAKMYWMYKEFAADGTYGTDNEYKGTHNGGHIKCSANKIYMRLPDASGVASYGMRFITPGTTAVDEITVHSAQNTEIYDLQGRKLVEITEPGMYIVNGKKVYVK